MTTLRRRRGRAMHRALRGTAQDAWLAHERKATVFRAWARDAILRDLHRQIADMWANGQADFSWADGEWIAPTTPGYWDVASVPRSTGGAS